MSAPLVRVAVLASGSGSNLQALLDADLRPAEITLVVCNVPGAGALDRAKAAGVEHLLIDHKAYPNREAFDQALAQALTQKRIDWVVLAGFMRLLTPVILDAFPERVVNIHPALLPAFPGTHAQRQALQAGVRITGCTVHLVDKGMDTGPILAQAAVPVRPQDDEAALSKRILREEHRIYPKVVKALAQDKLQRGPNGRPYLDLDGPGALSALRVPAFEEESR